MVTEITPSLELLRQPPKPDANPSAPRLEDFFTFRLAVLLNMISRQTHRFSGRGISITTSQRRILLFVGHFPGQTPATISRLSQMDKAQVSRTIKSMERHGWVSSRTDRADGRSKRIGLTASGRRAFKHIAPISQARQIELANILTLGEVTAFYRVLAKLTDYTCRSEMGPNG